MTLGTDTGREENRLLTTLSGCRHHRTVQQMRLTHLWTVVDVPLPGTSDEVANEVIELAPIAEASCAEGVFHYDICHRKFMFSDVDDAAVFLAAVENRLEAIAPAPRMM